MWPNKPTNKEEPGPEPTPRDSDKEAQAGSEPLPVTALAVHELISALSRHAGLSKVLALVSVTDCELVAEDAEGNRAPIIVLIATPR